MPYDIDRLASGHGNYDDSNFRARLKFCPSCGVSALLPHIRTLDTQSKQIEGKEFWCPLCGFSFNIRMSIKWKLAMRYFRDLRKMRTLHRYAESHIDPEVVEAFKKTQTPEGRTKDNIPGKLGKKVLTNIPGKVKRVEGKGWTMKEKLQAALGMV